MGKHGSNRFGERKKIKVKSYIETLAFSFVLLILLITGCGGEEKEVALDITKFDGEYLGEPFPYNDAEVFLDGLVAKEYSVQNVVFSPDGKEFYFTRTTLDNDSATIFVSYLKNNSWSLPEPAEFSTEFNESDPFITYDNQKLFFVSDRLVGNIEESYFDYNIWYVERDNGKWGNPKPLSEVNSTEDEYSPSLTGNGKIYFASARTNSEGYWDIYEADLVEGKYTEPEKSLYPVNTEYRDFDPFISKDGKKILFASDRPKGNGGGDLYLCVKGEDGRWEAPINLEEKVNTNDYEYFPRISYDGNFLFFTRLIPSEEHFYQDKAPDTRDPFEYIYLPEGGRGLVYWIAADSLFPVKF